MPNHSQEDRLEIYKEYLSLIYRKTMDQTTWNDWELSKIESLNKNGFDAVEWKAFGLTFKSFMQLRKDELSRQRARKGGIARSKNS